MNKLAKVFGGIATTLLVLGLFFKTQHWPGAGVGVVLSTFFFLFFYLPIKLLADWRKAEFGLDKWHAIIFFFTAFLGYAGVMFKVQHWPGSALFYLAGMIFVPLYLFIYFRRRKKIQRVLESSAHDFYISIAIFIVFFYVGKQGPSRTFLLQFSQMEEQNEALSLAYDATNTTLYSNLQKDSLVTNEEKALLSELDAATDSLSSCIVDMRSSLVMQLDPRRTKAEADTLRVNDVGRLENYDVPSMALIGRDRFNPITGPNTGNQLKLNIRTYLMLVDSLLMSQELLSSLVGLGLETEDARSSEDELVSWETKSFYNRMTVVVMAEISHVKMMVRQTENAALNALAQKFGNKNAEDHNLAQMEIFSQIEENKIQVEDLKSKQELNDMIVREKERELEAQSGIISFIAFAIFFVMILLILSTRAFVQKRKDNAKLEEQKKQINEQKELVEEKNGEILDSITYAKRIQSAILPPDKLVKEYLQESFVMYLPKDIVAGDFYWMEAVDDTVIFAAADCTGHGVPGAMVSVVCHNALNRAVREFELRDPAKILDKVREVVIETFEKSDEDVKDGMDIALCALKGNELHFAGAHNPLWLIRDGEILETKGNKQPIGKFDASTPFKSDNVQLKKGDSFYVFTDGFADQFGGQKGKKYKAANFKKLLLSIQDKSMTDQHAHIVEEFERWRGSLEQLDDVCVIGVSV